MQEQIDRIEQKVDKMSDALLGTEYTGGKGMIDAGTHGTKQDDRRGIQGSGQFDGELCIGLILVFVDNNLGFVVFL